MSECRVLTTTFIDFTLTTFQNGVVSKLVEHKEALRSSMVRICDLVQRNEFVTAMRHLGMCDVITDGDSDSPLRDNQDAPPINYKSIKLNLVKHLCESPNILHSHLSKNALRLLHSGEMSDMEFEVVSTQQPLCYSRSAYFLANDLPKLHIFRAHRAIVCSRCEYFRRALLSGMKEDICRKIVVQDTSPVIFRRFLLYLYGAPIDKTVGADQICELMLLGDRYSLDELKDICEQILKAQIDEESVICLLSIADRFNAHTLKSNCLAFISNRMHLIKQEIFLELGAKLKDEVYELLQWRSRTPQPWNSAEKQQQQQQQHQQLGGADEEDIAAESKQRLTASDGPNGNRNRSRTAGAPIHVTREFISAGERTINQNM